MQPLHGLDAVGDDVMVAGLDVEEESTCPTRIDDAGARLTRMMSLGSNVPSIEMESTVIVS